MHDTTTTNCTCSQQLFVTHAYMPSTKLQTAINKS